MYDRAGEVNCRIIVFGHRGDCYRRKCDRWTVRRDVIGIASSGIGRALSYVVSVIPGKTTVLP